MFEDNMNQENFSCPVEVGKEYDVKIEDKGRSGDGIARVEGFVVFVPEVEVGQEVTIKINTTRRKFAFGEVVA
ncbi:TRAM domain-containing protein [Methanobrevibacter sp. DSM 116169]|uniref:TRAM domain-containing protein n=1 Tax=Methanobrevibacter sp. DSM 116169 TaxID=3242727 RepID=UPI0038FC9AC2